MSKPFPELIPLLAARGLCTSGPGWGAGGGSPKAGSSLRSLGETLGEAACLPGTLVALC